MITLSHVVTDCHCLLLFEISVKEFMSFFGFGFDDI